MNEVVSVRDLRRRWKLHKERLNGHAWRCLMEMRSEQHHLLP
jgi:hypothetical protein